MGALKPIVGVLIVSLLGLGPGRLSVTAQDTPPRTRDITRERSTERKAETGRKWAVLVGINNYLDSSISNLKYCVADAREMERVLTECCGYEKARVLVIADDQRREHLRPFRFNLDQQIRNWLLKAAPGDTVLVYFSGHGFMDSASDGYLAPKDCKRENLPLTAFSTNALHKMLSVCKATKKLLILDCCHAGSVKGEEDDRTSAEDLGAEFEKAEGLITLASCRKNEKSNEWDEKGQGLFTYYLVEGLSNGRGDYDSDGIINSDELFRYTAKYVPLSAQRELNRKQTPVRIIGRDVVGIFPVARINRSGPRQPRPPRSARAPFAANAARSFCRTWADHLKVPLIRETSIGMNLTLIPPGDFQMGSRESPEDVARSFPGESADTFENEHPRHLVKITKPFYMGQTEVTVAQFRTFVAATEYRTTAESHSRSANPTDARDASEANLSWRTVDGGIAQDLYPVRLVSWHDAQAFCRWLSKREGQRFRLSTQAEWEYACRAGTTTRYWCGNDPEMLAANANVPDKSLTESIGGTPQDYEFSWFSGDQKTGRNGWRDFNCSPGDQFDCFVVAQGQESVWVVKKKLFPSPSAREAGKVIVVNNSDQPSALLYLKIGDREEKVAPGNQVSFRPVFLDKTVRILADDGFSGPAPVASFKPNPFGLYDMHGNVWEWCQDPYDTDGYVPTEEVDPIGPATSDLYAIRGGCFL